MLNKVIAELVCQIIQCTGKLFQPVHVLRQVLRAILECFVIFSCSAVYQSSTDNINLHLLFYRISNFLSGCTQANRHTNRRE